MLKWPEHILPDSLDVTLVSNNALFESPITGNTQTVELNGARLRLSMGFNSMTEKNSREVWSILMQLNGVAGRIYMRDYSAYPVKVHPNSKPVIMQNTQSKKYYKTKGWVANSTVLNIGDYISVNDELKVVVQTVVSNDKGEADIYVSPNVRFFPKDNTPVIVDKPYGLFRLEKDENKKTVKGFYNHSFKLEFIEAF